MVLCGLQPLVHASNLLSERAGTPKQVGGSSADGRADLTGRTRPPRDLSGIRSRVHSR